MRNGQKLFHRHDSLLVYIVSVDSPCQICDEKVPDGVKFQGLLLEETGIFWTYREDGYIYITGSDARDACSAITPRGSIEDYQDLRPAIIDLLAKYGKA